MDFRAFLRRAADDQHGEPYIEHGPIDGQPQPPACAYCGASEFEAPVDNGRVERMKCSACGGTMISHGGAWMPDLIGQPDNHPKDLPDPRSGGVPGVGNAAPVRKREEDLNSRTAMPSRKHPAPADVSFRVETHAPGTYEYESMNGPYEIPWSHHTLHAERGGQQVGKIDFSKTTDDRQSLKIHYMQVPQPHRSQGIASAMQDHLRELHPGHMFDHGARSPEGQAWADQYSDPGDPRLDLDHPDNVHEWGKHEMISKKIAMPGRHPAPPGMRYDTYDAPPDSYHFEEAEESHPGWSHHLLRAHDPQPGSEHPVDHYNAHMVGSIYYSKTPEGAEHPGIAIHDMSVREKHRGRGYASAMQDELRRQHPDHMIDHGSRTPSGAGWWSQYTDPGDPKLDLRHPDNAGTEHRYRPTPLAEHLMTKNLDHLGAVDWCRHRHAEHCWLPAQQPAGGVAIYTPQDRGVCPWTTAGMQQINCPVSEPGPMAGMSRAATTNGMTSDWETIGDRHPDLYGEDDGDSHGLSDAVAHLAFDRPGAHHGEDEFHEAHDLTFQHEQVDPKHIDYARHERGDHRVTKARQGYQQEGGRNKVPPLLLVHRHGVYQVADGHHRAQAAHEAGSMVNAYVAYSPHPDEPFSDGEKGPYHGAEQTEGHPMKTAALDIWREPEWRFHVLSAWADVRQKAVGIRQSGGVSIVSALADGITGHVNGDTGVYETQINYVPGTFKIGYWQCGCAWASYAWGRSAPYRRFEGRMCSHALALTYEAQSRGMFGREVREDTRRPDWLRDKVRVRHDRDTRQHDLRAAARQNDPDGVYADDHGLDLTGLPIHAFAQEAYGRQGDPADALRVYLAAGIEHRMARGLLQNLQQLAATGSNDDLSHPDNDPSHPLNHLNLQRRLDKAVEEEHAKHQDDATYSENFHPLKNSDVPVEHHPGWRFQQNREAAPKDQGEIDLHDTLREIGWSDKEIGRPGHETNKDHAPVPVTSYRHPMAREPLHLDEHGNAWARHHVDQGVDENGDAKYPRFSHWSGPHSASEVVANHPLWSRRQGPDGKTEINWMSHGERYKYTNTDPTTPHREVTRKHFQTLREHGWGVVGALAEIPCPDCDATGKVEHREPNFTLDGEPLPEKHDTVTHETCDTCSGSGTAPAISDDELAEQERSAQQGLDERARTHMAEHHPNGETRLTDYCGPRCPVVQQKYKKGAAEKPDEPTHAGVVLKAQDTGRILMIQRSHKDEDDPARGRWEFPGGGREEGDEHSLHSGIREFEEEVGHPFPTGGHVQHVWQSPNGVYQGHVVVVPSEDCLDFSHGRSTVNPDDPDGDDHEQSAWWHPKDAERNPALRNEVKKAPWDMIKKASLETTAASVDLPHPGRFPDDHEFVQQNQENYRWHGDKYRLHHEPWGLGNTQINAFVRHGENYRHIGSLSWFGGENRGNEGSTIDGGLIHKVYVAPRHRRKGVASAMLDFAREVRPDVRHSRVLSEDGQAWADKKASLDSHANWHDNSVLEAFRARVAGYASGDALEDMGTDWRPKAPPKAPERGQDVNPGSTGWATGGDPPEWENAAQRAETMSLATGLTAELHEEPEAALPSTTAEPQTDAETMPYGYDDLTEFREDHGERLRSQMSSQIGGTESIMPSDGRTASAGDIVARFQASAAGRALQGSGGSRNGDNDMASIADAARQHLAGRGGIQRTALKDFSAMEQMELISEGQGQRARNFGDLDIANTHYEALNTAIAREQSLADANDLFD